jgi:hypothetical protein
MVSRSRDAVNVAALNRALPRHNAAKTKPNQNVSRNKRSIFQKPLRNFRK